MDKIYRLGVIGCGGIGTNVHLKQLAEVNGAIVTALCDIDPQHLQMLQKNITLMQHSVIPITRI